MEIGQTYGRLEVLEIGEPSKVSGHRKIRCRCSCGTEKVVWSSNLTSGTTKSCGCIPRGRPRKDACIAVMRATEDFDGYSAEVSPKAAPKSQKPPKPPKEKKPPRETKVSRVFDFEVFGDLVVLEPAVLTLTCCDSMRPWLCRCRCGNLTVVRADRLAYGTTKSCGCRLVRSTQRQIAVLQKRLAHAMRGDAERAAFSQRLSETRPHVRALFHPKGPFEALEGRGDLLSED